MFKKDILNQKILDFINMLEGSDNLIAILNYTKRRLAEISPEKHNPVDCVVWVPLEKVEPNDYNPNNVARTEMQLLLSSILHDGYTQPVVTIYDESREVYVIVDGFHRYYTMKSSKKLYERCGGLLPVVVIDKDVNDRMASTVRHNRARGRHSVDGMASMIFKMLDNGMLDSDICNELGMEPEELLRLKHVTGFSKLFDNTDYQKAWLTRSQIEQKRKYLAASNKSCN